MSIVGIAGMDASAENAGESVTNSMTGMAAHVKGVEKPYMSGLDASACAAARSETKSISGFIKMILRKPSVRPAGRSKDSKRLPALPVMD